MALLRDSKSMEQPESISSFRTVEVILADVVELCLRNRRLKKLLYYTDKHALGLPDLTDEQTRTLIGNQIKIVPKLTVEPDAKPYLIIGLDSFVPQRDQTTFRQVVLSIDIFCDYNYWILDNFKLRPYTIAGEIDGMLNNSYINGTQLADFISAKQLVLNEYLGGVTLNYLLETFSDDYQVHEARRN